MTGYRTLILNGLLAVGTSALTYIGGVDWAQYVSPTTAVLIVTVSNFAMRFATTTPVGAKPTP